MAGTGDERKPLCAATRRHGPTEQPPDPTARRAFPQARNAGRLLGQGLRSDHRHLPRQQRQCYRRLTRLLQARRRHHRRQIPLTDARREREPVDGQHGGLSRHDRHGESDFLRGPAWEDPLLRRQRRLSAGHHPGRESRTADRSARPDRGPDRHAHGQRLLHRAGRRGRRRRLVLGSPAGHHRRRFSHAGREAQDDHPRRGGRRGRRDRRWRRLLKPPDAHDRRDGGQGRRLPGLRRDRRRSGHPGF